MTFLSVAAAAAVVVVDDLFAFAVALFLHLFFRFLAWRY